MADYIDNLTEKEKEMLIKALSPGNLSVDIRELLDGTFEEKQVQKLLAKLKEVDPGYASPGGKSGSLLPKVKPVKITKFAPPSAKKAKGGKAPAEAAPAPGAPTEAAPAPNAVAYPPAHSATQANTDLDLKIFPPKNFKWQDYVPREDEPEMQGFLERPDYIRKIQMFTNTGHNLLLIGEAGSGKSTIGRYYAMQKGFPYLAISADGLMGVRELFGLPQITGATSYFVEGMFTTFTQIGHKFNPKTGEYEDNPEEPGAIILIDEVTALDPSKNFIFHQILAERRFFVRDANKTYKVSPKCIFMFAGNPKDPRYPGVGKMNLAFADRMGTLILEPLLLSEIEKIVKDNYVKPKLITSADLEFIIMYVEKMQDFIRNSPEPLPSELSMRSIKRIASFLSQGATRTEAVELGFLNTYTAFDKDTYDTLRGHSKSIVLG